MVDFADLANLSPDAMIAEAAATTGLSNFDSDSFHEGLELVCAGLRQDRITKGGRRMLGRDCVRYLSNRLRVDQYHRDHPDIGDVDVQAPVVILGLPRTGTTAVSYLLDQDPQWRSLLHWEATDSVPPPTSASLRTDPRCIETLAFQQEVLPLIDPPPPHWEWADGPTECTFVLAQDFKAAMWESRIPNIAYRDFISTVDMSSAYDHHRRVLQVLQHRAPGRWCLKMPAHAFFIDALLDRYPDARIVWTHRDPAVAAASFMNLTAFAHTLSMGSADIGWIVKNVPTRLVEQVRRPMLALAGRDVHHMHYDRYIADPIAAMAGLYEWLDVPWLPPARQAMETWLAADPLAESRKATYSLESFGLTRNEVLAKFTEYIETFGVFTQT